MSLTLPRNFHASIFLYGPSGSGKSTVGRILARNLNLPFFDLDTEIESQSGSSISEIFHQLGESGFRHLEQQVLSTLITSSDKVVALGGGTLTLPANRDLVDGNGRVIVLNAASGILSSRLQKDSIERPLLSTKSKNIEEIPGFQPIGLETYLAKRKTHYDSFPLQMDTSSQTPSEVAWRLQIHLGLFHITAMSTPQHPGYDLRIVPGGLGMLGDMLKFRRLNGPIIVVTDENVGSFFLPKVLDSLSIAGYQAKGIILPPGETIKTLETVSKLWEGFLTANVERSSTVVALGGGVIGDLVGFTAATFLRGVPWVAVPTSIIAMVDASIGGKTGADLPQGKNLIGAFHPPRLVLADPEVLTYLPMIEFANGMAEVIKHGVIADPDLFYDCANFELPGEPVARNHILNRSISVKVNIIEADPFEVGIRAVLNYGHTVGHGVEIASAFHLRHGEAVAIGMVAEARMAESIGLADVGIANDIASILDHFNLPVHIPDTLDREAIATAMMHDKKKFGSQLKFALPITIGDVRSGQIVNNWREILWSL
jgi:shikimate kinase/3-dehydroquinate synthase